RRASKVYVLPMAAILTMFVIALVLWTLDVVKFIVETKITLVEDSDDTIEDKYERALAFIFRLAAAEDALYAYMALLGDAIIIYRVWMLKAYYRLWVFFIPFATLMLTYCVAIAGSEIILGNFENPAFCRNVQMVTYAMPLATTTVATILLGITTWSDSFLYNWPLSRHNVCTSSDLTNKSRRREGERILLLLVESGFLYFLFFAIQVVEDIPQVHSWIETQTGVSFAFMMYAYCSSVIVGIYPTILIVLAHSKRGVIDGAVARTRIQMSNQTMSTILPTFQVDVETRVDEIELNHVLSPRADKEQAGRSWKPT
ncbi:hypothetical protein B0H13DRAFT_1664850, partial [Mycena leptocephala]